MSQRRVIGGRLGSRRATTNDCLCRFTSMMIRTDARQQRAPSSLNARRLRDAVWLWVCVFYNNIVVWFNQIEDPSYWPYSIINIAEIKVLILPSHIVNTSLIKEVGACCSRSGILHTSMLCIFSKCSAISEISPYFLHPTVLYIGWTPKKCTKVCPVIKETLINPCARSSESKFKFKLPEPRFLAGEPKHFPLQLFLVWSLKSLWHVRGAFLKKWQLRWPPLRNITSEYPCAVAILTAISSGFLPVRLVEKSYFLVILLGKIASYM